MKESERDKRESKRAKGSWQLRKTAVGLFYYFGVSHNTAARGKKVTFRFQRRACWWQSGQWKRTEFQRYQRTKGNHLRDTLDGVYAWGYIDFARQGVANPLLKNTFAFRNGGNQKIMFLIWFRRLRAKGWVFSVVHADFAKAYSPSFCEMSGGIKQNPHI